MLDVDVLVFEVVSVTEEVVGRDSDVSLHIVTVVVSADTAVELFLDKLLLIGNVHKRVELCMQLVHILARQEVLIRERLHLIIGQVLLLLVVLIQVGIATASLRKASLR